MRGEDKKSRKSKGKGGGERKRGGNRKEEWENDNEWRGMGGVNRRCGSWRCGF